MEEKIGYFLTFLVLASTVIPLLKFSDWWIRICDFPRLQIIGTGFIAMAFFLFDFNPLTLPEIISIILIGIAIGYQSYMIFPFSPFHKKQVKKARNPEKNDIIRLVMCNVYMFNKDYKRCLKVINERDPDVILLVETNSWWKEKLEPLGKGRSNQVLNPLENTYGMLLFSRFVLEDIKVKFLVEDQVPSIHARVVLPSGKRIRIHCLHPKPPSPTHSLESTNRDAELLVVGEEVKKSNEPVIVCGDMNDVAWSYTTNLFQKISGLLDPRIGRGMFNTFHAKVPFFRWPLDHFFVSKHFLLVDIQRMKKIGSDHFPMALDLVFQPENGQEELKADEDEKELMKEKIEEVEGKVKKPNL